MASLANYFISQNQKKIFFSKKGFVSLWPRFRFHRFRIGLLYRRQTFRTRLAEFRFEHFRFEHFFRHLLDVGSRRFGQRRQLPGPAAFPVPFVVHFRFSSLPVTSSRSTKCQCSQFCSLLIDLYLIRASWITKALKDHHIQVAQAGRGAQKCPLGPLGDCAHLQSNASGTLWKYQVLIFKNYS